MQHKIPVAKLGTLGPPMAAAVEACVHCGFCLPSCPTYQVLGQEMDSPRGRIVLMKEVLEGELAAAEAKPYIDRCLGCMGCVTACPSGVAYGELISPFRAHLRQAVPSRRSTSLRQSLVAHTLPYPQRFRLAARLGRLARPVRALVPKALRPMLDLLPPRLPAARPLPRLRKAEGQRRARVALLAGCAQQVLAPEINHAALDLLAANGVEVIVPPDQGCCGALAWHNGEAKLARRQARRNLDAFSKDVDAVLTTAAGCGAGMKEYDLMLRGQLSADEAAMTHFTTKVQDISTFLVALGLRPPPHPVAQKVAYHDACHLAHAQGEQAAPRRLLAAIPELELVEIPDGEICCGSAGTYNLDQPQIAATLGSTKAQRILSTGTERVAAGNIGCLVQIRTHLQRQGSTLPVQHTVEILAAAYTPSSR